MHCAKGDGKTNIKAKGREENYSSKAESSVKGERAYLFQYARALMHVLIIVTHSLLLLYFSFHKESKRKAAKLQFFCALSSRMKKKNKTESEIPALQSSTSNC